MMPAGTIVHRHSINVKESGQTVEYLQAEIAALRQKKDQIASKLKEQEHLISQLDVFKNKDTVEACRKLIVLLREPDITTISSNESTFSESQLGEVFFD